MPVYDPIEMTVDEYLAEAERRFGPDKLDWRFVCPVCGHVASAREYKEAGAPETAPGFNCIGRYNGLARRNAFGEDSKGPGPCDYATGGFFNVSPVKLGESTYVFALAEETEAAEAAGRTG